MIDPKVKEILRQAHVSNEKLRAEILADTKKYYEEQVSRLLAREGLTSEQFDKWAEHIDSQYKKHVDTTNLKFDIFKLRYEGKSEEANAKQEELYSRVPGLREGVAKAREYYDEKFKK